jgi:hypothetical protein
MHWLRGPEEVSTCRGIGSVIDCLRGRIMKKRTIGGPGDSGHQNAALRLVCSGLLNGTPAYFDAILAVSQVEG